MNILIVTNTFTPHVGGVARSVEAFTEAYRALGHRVLAFEPVPDNCRVLTHSIAYNGLEELIQLVPAAVTSSVGEVSLYVPKSRSDNSSLDRSAATINVGSKETDVMVVPCTSLDQWMRQHGSASNFVIERCRLLKIDVQGFEEDVIRGAEEFLRQAAKQSTRFLVEFEFDPSMIRAAGKLPTTPLRLLQSYGFEVRFNGRTLSTYDTGEMEQNLVAQGTRSVDLLALPSRF